MCVEGGYGSGGVCGGESMAVVMCVCGGGYGGGGVREGVWWCKGRGYGGVKGGGMVV